MLLNEWLTDDRAVIVDIVTDAVRMEAKRPLLVG